MKKIVKENLSKYDNELLSLEELAEEQSEIESNKSRSRSFSKNQNLEIKDTKDVSSSHSNLINTSLSNKKIPSESPSMHFDKKNSSASDKTSPLAMFKQRESSGSEIRMKKRKTTGVNEDSKFKRKRTSSVNSFTSEFHSKKLIPKTKEIYGINRVAIFHNK